MSDKPQRPPFGWLILGLACGLTLGHWVAFGFAIPTGYAREYVERLTVILAATSFAGAAFAAAIEPLLRRFSLVYSWLLWFALTGTYFVLFGGPIMQAARE